MISVIDYGSGNLQAFLNILKKFKFEFAVISKGEDFDTNTTKIILPGVGSFDEAIEELEKRNLKKALCEKVLDKKIPILGICVGMQIMASSSDEGKLSGFNWIPGRVRLFDSKEINHDTKTPHMGWNNIYPNSESEV